MFTAILFMNQFVRIFNNAILLGADLQWIFYALCQLMPTVLALSIPMAWQLSVLMSLGALSSHGEILALRASGFSRFQIVWPLGIFSLFLCIALFFVNNWISPLGFKKFANSKHILAKSISELQLQPNTFIDLGNWRMIANEIDSNSGNMSEIALFMRSQEDPDLVLLNVNAPKGRYKLLPAKGIELTLEDGDFQKVDPSDSSSIIKGEYKNYKIFIPLYGNMDFENRNLSLSELTTPEILKTIRQKTLPQKRHAEYKIELSTRIALAFSPLVFFLVSAPLGLLSFKHAKAWAMVFTIAVLFGYYGGMMTGINIAKKIYSLSFVSPWLGNIVGLVAALFLWNRKFSR